MSAECGPLDQSGSSPSRPLVRSATEIVAMARRTLDRKNGATLLFRLASFFWRHDLRLEAVPALVAVKASENRHEYPDLEGAGSHRPDPIP